MASHIYSVATKFKVKSFESQIIIYEKFQPKQTGEKLDASTVI